MIRPCSLALATGIALLATSLCGADETFPVVHNEPITVRIVGGVNGMPLSNLHLVLLGGYDESDLHDQIYREEVLTDTFGNARLPKQLANLPWLQVWVGSMPLCQTKPRKTSFSVELIRRDGLNAPNLCGAVSAQETPGVFTVFVKNKAKKLKKGASIAVGLPITPAARTEAAAAANAKTTSPVAPDSTTRVVSSVVTPVVVSPAPAPVEAAPKTAVIVAPAATPTPAPIPAPALAHLPASASLLHPINLTPHPRPRRIMAKRAVHRAKPVPPACSAQMPVAKAAPAHWVNDRDKKAQLVKVSATHRSKPHAGVHLAAPKNALPADQKKVE